MIRRKTVTTQKIDLPIKTIIGGVLTILSPISIAQVQSPTYSGDMGFDCYGIAIEGCSVNLESEIDTSTGSILVTNITVGGPTLCNQVQFSEFPWAGQLDYGSGSADFSGAKVYMGPYCTCSGALNDVNFAGNPVPTSISFDHSLQACLLSGTLTNP